MCLFVFEANSMLTKPKVVIIGCGIAACLALSGCSGDDPATDATASATPQATTTATPKAPKTPEPNISPLGGKPATEEEKEYYRLQKKAEDMVLSRNYEEAIPLLEQAMEQRPDDPENPFYLLLSHGSLEMVPSKGSAAYPYAKKILELDPKSNEAARARAYLIGAEFTVPKDFKYGPKTSFTYGAFLYDTKTPYKLVVDTPLHSKMNARLGKDAKAKLWEAEVAPKMAGKTLKLPKGTEVEVLSEAHYFHSLTSWRKPLPAQPKEYSDSIFEVNAFYVEVVSDDDNKGKKGWIVNQVDRYVDKDREDPFGVWIKDRLNLVREAEAPIE
jgi:tetratricopeptide (TPR) repeat protein